MFLSQLFSIDMIYFCQVAGKLLQMCSYSSSILSSVFFQYTKMNSRNQRNTTNITLKSSGYSISQSGQLMFIWSTSRLNSLGTSLVITLVQEMMTFNFF